MERVPEPELMDEEEQAAAYAGADFSEAHDRFVALFRERFSTERPRRVLDLGCGPADVMVRFSRAFPEARMVGVDGAEAMLRRGRERIRREHLEDRVELLLGHIPGVPIAGRFDAVISNSLLHHLETPSALWETVKRCGTPGAAVFVIDLLRPSSAREVSAFVQTYSGGEPEILQRDFAASLRAAYRVDEVRAQLEEAGLGGSLAVEAVSDRHLRVHGRLR